MEESLFSKILFYIGDRYITIYNYHDSETFNDFYRELHSYMSMRSKYVFDGRFEKILFEELTYASKYELKYEEFIKRLEEGMEQLSVPCLIVIPLNCINNNAIPRRIDISENIKLFKTDHPIIEYKLFRTIQRKTELEKYYEETVYARLLRDHILEAKDRNFFNYPILTIKVENIDWRVEIESGRIVSAVYAFIRMLDFNSPMDFGGWGYLMEAGYPPARVYGVYYNKEGTPPTPPYDNGYGYSLRFQCEPILDVSTQNFIDNGLKSFRSLLTKFIDICFCDKRKIVDKRLEKKLKWQNAVLMFNRAYESASIENYDAALIFLLVILESLFIANSGNKKEKIILELEAFFNQSKKVGKERIRPLITKAYQMRNKFVHEGKGIDNDTYIKSMHHYQGMVSGMKPFARLGLGHYPSLHDELVELFKLVIVVLTTYY